jgi:amino acid permease
MANLSTTSTISVIFDVLMVLIVAVSSPVSESIAESGGITKVLKESTIHGSTFFIGLGVLSFAFVCQDSSFIIAGSLHKPTKQRWGTVTRSSLLMCTLLGIIIGVTGYLGFQGKTNGNILTNFLDLPRTEMLPFGYIYTYQAINMARTLLGLTMFCVYPLASYVARHALIVLLFTGKSAKAGDDHSVLARFDRRFILTFALYLSALVPAIICNELGTVLALTGAVAGSSLSYLGPGIAYLGVHGLTFLREVKRKWNVKDSFNRYMWKYPNRHYKESKIEPLGWLSSILYIIAWYCLFMPLWMLIAMEGGNNFDDFEKKQMLKSPAIQKRLGKIVHKSKTRSIECGSSGLNQHNSIPQGTYGSINRNVNNNCALSDDEEEEEEDPQEECPPTFNDFILAIAYIILGAVALVAGIYSLYAE